MNMKVMTRRSHTRAFVVKVAALAAMLVTTAADAAVYYVDKDYAGTEVGTDPDQPFNTIREAVDAAKANAGADEIRIATGTYDNAIEQWSTLGQYDVSFTGSGTDGLTVRGGYGGVGDWASRTPRTTIVDLAGAGTRAFYHNDTGSPLNTYILYFDGVTFQNAYHAGDGGAIYVYETGRYDRSLTITNCLFRHNTSTNGNGGAVYMIAYNVSRVVGCDFHTNTVSGASKYAGALAMSAYGNTAVAAANRRLESCTFVGNKATGSGGYAGAMAPNAIPETVPARPLDITNCVFEANSAPTAGALGWAASTGWAKLSRCVFRRNASTGVGAAVYVPRTGAGTRGLIAENALFHDNTGGYAVSFYFSSGAATPQQYVLELTHCTITDNPGGGVQADDETQNWVRNDARIRNCIIANNGAVGVRHNNQYSPSPDTSSYSNALYAAYNDVYGHTNANYQIVKADGPANSVTLDPKFVSASADNYRLTVGSPCRNAATNLSVTVDLEGNARPFNAKDTGIDMGCYEMAPPAKGTAVMVK